MEIVVDGGFGWEAHLDADVLGGGGVVLEFVDAAEIDLVCAVPEETLLAMFEIEIDDDVRLLQRQWMVNDLVCALGDGLAVDDAIDHFDGRRGVEGGGRSLSLGGAPGADDTVLET